ncbi:MAG: hypothetical protein Q9221_004165 [Calogaya cf. arnoldii]
MKAGDSERLKAHVAELEVQLQTAKALLRRTEAQSIGQLPNRDIHRPSISRTSRHFGVPVSLPLGISIHNLMLLSDSALPLGSFAYSSGLESFLAHHKPLREGGTQLSLFHKFLRLTIQSVAYNSIPYALAAFRGPLDLMELDNDLDASILCTVARRASIAQGRALLSVWERGFKESARSQFSEEGLEAATSIDTFASDLKIAALSPEPITVNGHLAPIWGAVSLALGLNLEEAGYLFLLNHAKAVTSAAVRASVMGPYMAQNVLASQALQELVRSSLEKVWLTPPEDAGQVVPMMDLWVGRHEMLYSRIFNS